MKNINDDNKPFGVIMMVNSIAIAYTLKLNQSNI